MAKVHFVTLKHMTSRATVRVEVKGFDTENPWLLVWYGGIYEVSLESGQGLGPLRYWVLEHCKEFEALRRQFQAEHPERHFLRRLEPRAHWLVQPKPKPKPKPTDPRQLSIVEES